MKKISELPASTTNGSAGYIPIVEGGVTLKILGSKLSKGLAKQVLTDAATITLDYSLGFNFFSIASIAATRTLLLTNAGDKDFGLIAIGATNGFKVIYNGTTLNLPTSGSATVSFVVDGTNVIWEITPTVIIATTTGGGGGGGGVVYDTNAQTYFTALAATDGTITTAQKTAYNKLVVDLKAANLYSKFTRLGTALGGTAASQAIDAITGASILTYNGTVNHSAAGIDADGSGYSNTNVLANTLLPGNFSFFLKLTENTVSIFNSYDFGNLVSGSNALAFSARLGSDEVKIFAAGGPFAIASTDAIGLWAATANSINELRLYKNGTAVISDITARTGTFPAAPLYLSTIDTSGSFNSNRNIPFYAFGTGFTDAEAIQANNIITTFLASI